MASLPSFTSMRILAARGETPAAFGRRCIPVGCVAPPSNTPGILSRRALPTGRLAGLGATLAFHHGLLLAVAILFPIAGAAQGTPTVPVFTPHDVVLTASGSYGNPYVDLAAEAAVTGPEAVGCASRCSGTASRAGGCACHRIVRARGAGPSRAWTPD